MKFHVLTLNWNGCDKLKRLRTGLSNNLLHIVMKDGKLTDPFQMAEWYIKDNGSKDDSVDELNSWRFKSDTPISPIVYETGHNRDSFAKGVNYLFEQANPSDDDIIILLNNDIIFKDNNSLKNMYLLMKKTGAAVVGARLLYTDTDTLQHAGVIFGERYGRMPYHFRPGEKSDVNAEKNRYFQAVTAAVCMVKAGVFRKIGGMDEKFRWSFEDIDMCLQIGKSGGKIAYCGNTEIYHEESASLKKNPVNKMFMQSNVKHFRSKWNGKYTLDHELYLKDPEYQVIK